MHLIEIQDKNEWESKSLSNGTFAIAKWTNNGYLYWKKFHISDLPNDEVSLYDLKFLSVDIIDAVAI